MSDNTKLNFALHSNNAFQACDVSLKQIFPVCKIVNHISPYHDLSEYIAITQLLLAFLSLIATYLIIPKWKQDLLSLTEVVITELQVFESLMQRQI